MAGSPGTAGELPFSQSQLACWQDQSSWHQPDWPGDNAWDPWPLGSAAQGSARWRLRVDGAQRMNQDPALSAALYKTRMCTHFLMQRCSRQNCKFAHSEAELRAAPDWRKTTMCHFMTDRGYCRYADCHFAHSEAELRMRPEGDVRQGLARTLSPTSELFEVGTTAETDYRTLRESPPLQCVDGECNTGSVGAGEAGAAVASTTSRHSHSRVEAVPLSGRRRLPQPPDPPCLGEGVQPAVIELAVDASSTFAAPAVQPQVARPALTNVLAHFGLPAGEPLQPADALTGTRFSV